MAAAAFNSLLVRVAGVPKKQNHEGKIHNEPVYGPDIECSKLMRDAPRIGQ